MSEYRKMPLGSDVESVDVTPKFGAYTGVEIIRDEEHADFYGDRSGRVLTIQNPWGSVQQARNILSALTQAGFQYQPFSAVRALLNPAAELGDGVTASGIYSGIYTLDKRFGAQVTADVSAPQDEEVDHEYPFEPQRDRVFKREIADTRATLSVLSDRVTSDVSRLDDADTALSSRITQTSTAITTEVSQRKAADTALSSRITQTASDISAEVAGKVGENGGKKETFGWKLTSSAWELYANKQTVFRATKDGVSVTGEIKATSGKIGGFTIGATAITYGDLTYGDSTRNKAGIYIGTSGIQLGSTSGSYFQASRDGSVVAQNLKLLGTLTIGSDTISANDLRQGAKRANAGYTGWNSTSTTVGNNSGYWGRGGVAGTKFDNMANQAAAYPINASSFRVNGIQYSPRDITVSDNFGTRTFKGVLMYSVE